MSVGLWEKLPSGFLKIGFNRWHKLDHGVRRLVVELAESQKFKCALCSATRNLVIEHDHDPEEGRGDIPTIFNIRDSHASAAIGTSGTTRKSKMGNTGDGTTSSPTSPAMIMNPTPMSMNAGSAR